MTFFTRCPVCRRQSFYIKKRRYVAPQVHPMPIVSDIELCTRCFENVKFLTLGKWSARHYWKYGIVKLTNLINKFI